MRRKNNLLRIRFIFLRRGFSISSTAGERDRSGELPGLVFQDGNSQRIARHAGVRPEFKIRAFVLSGNKKGCLLSILIGGDYRTRTGHLDTASVAL